MGLNLLWLGSRVGLRQIQILPLLGFILASAPKTVQLTQTQDQKDQKVRIVSGKLQESQ